MNIIKAACDYLQPIADSAAITNYARALNTVITAAKTQIPQRPRIGKGPFACYRYGPTCNRILKVSERRPYCDMCGQAIAWEGGAAVRQKQKPTRRGRNEKEKPNT